MKNNIIALYETENGTNMVPISEWKEVKESSMTIRSLFIEVDQSTADSLPLLNQEERTEISRSFLDNNSSTIHSN